jgi:asparagine synthase (glutamine-hydrolysing)
MKKSIPLNNTMCGISGIIKSEGTKIDVSQLKLISDLISHRGPDSQGFWYEKNVGLSHNRLSLLDLSENANQPFQNERYKLIFNGEIYNWKQLRAELSDNNFTFHTSSDTEVLFHGLIFWGIETTLSKLKGMFAFAWFDTLSNELILARDRVGIKPLFYGLIRGEFQFASEVKALCTDLGMEDLNMHYLAQAYYGVYETQRHISPFKHIHQLEPGHLLKLNTNTLAFEIKQWFSLGNWSDSTEFARRDKLKAEEIRDEFAELFKTSVESMAIADAPMGTFVSGGLDSSIVAATSKKYADLSLFTANVVGKYSEFSAATALANHLNTPLNEYRYLPEYFIRDIVDTTFQYDGPITLFTNSVAFSGVAKLAREKEVKAVLTGEGADEIFLGYPQLLTQRWDSLINAPYNLINQIYKRIPGMASYLKINNIDMQKVILQGHLNGNKERTNDIEAMSAYSHLINNKEEYRCQGISINMIHRHLHSLLWRNDRMGMMHSIESRFPFLDEDLLKFGLNLPYRFKIGRTNQIYNWKHPFHMDKAVARNYGKQILPISLANKAKFGFGVQGHSKAELKIDKSFFENGFWQEATGMSNSALNLMYKECDPKLLAKLSSVEIWGSLFVNKQSKDTVNSRVEANFTMKL